MLLSFSVENFRSIMERQTLSMVGTSLDGSHAPIRAPLPGVDHGLLPCALIYGANASGKSNLLQAFMSMKSMVLRSSADSQSGKKLKQTPFKLRPDLLDAPTKFECIFEADGVRYDYSFEFSSDRVVAETLDAFPEGRRRKLFARRGLEVEFGAGMKGTKKAFTSFLKDTSLLLSVVLQSEESDLNPISEFFNSIFGSNQIAVQRTQIDHSFSSRGVDPRAIKFLNMIGTGVCEYRVEEIALPATQINLLREVMNAIASSEEIDITDGEIEIPEKEYRVELGHRSSTNDVIFFGAEIESAGTRRLLVLMDDVFKALDKGCVAVIDEIDASLHTFAVRAIVELFTDYRINRNGAQLIATTHDTNVLDTTVLRRDEIWFTEKSNLGASEYFSLAEIKRRKDEVFEKAYLSGRYGAIPYALDKTVFEGSSVT